MKVFVFAGILGILGGLTVRIALDDKKSVNKKIKQVTVLTGIFIAMVVFMSNT